MMPHRTSVLHAVGVLIDGGVPLYVHRLAKAQVESGQRPIIACDTGSYMWQLIERDGAGIERVPWSSPSLRPQRLHRSYRSLTSVLAAYQPDVLHLHSSLSGLVGRLRNNDARSVVFQPHAWSFNALTNRLRPVGHMYESRAAQRADMVLCGSTDEAAEGRSAGVKVPLTVVPNAVDLERFVPMPLHERQLLQKELLGEVAEGPVIVTVGRLANQKGGFCLLDAWEQVHSARPDATLVMVGDGPLRADLSARAHSSVRFVGSSNEPCHWHQMADLSVYASEYETLSLSLLEALACGSPVVTTDVSGAASAVVDGAEPPAGRLVPIGNVQALAQAIIRQLESPTLATEDRVAARQRSTNYDQRHWEKDMVSLYENLVEKKTSPNLLP